VGPEGTLWLPPPQEITNRFQAPQPGSGNRGRLALSSAMPIRETEYASPDRQQSGTEPNPTGLVNHKWQVHGHKRSKSVDQISRNGKIRIDNNQAQIISLARIRRQFTHQRLFTTYSRGLLSVLAGLPECLFAKKVSLPSGLTAKMPFGAGCRF
jgi:hypothetical protein